MHRVHGPDPAGRRAEEALARFARPGPGSNDLGEKVLCFTKEANTKAGNGNPNPLNPPIPPELLFNVPVLPLRSDVHVPSSCAPRGDRTPGRGTRRRWGGFRRWFQRLVVGAMRKKLDARFPAVRFNLRSCDWFEFLYPGSCAYLCADDRYVWLCYACGCLNFWWWSLLAISFFLFCSSSWKVSLWFHWIGML